MAILILSLLNAFIFWELNKRCKYYKRKYYEYQLKYYELKNRNHPN